MMLGLENIEQELDFSRNWRMLFVFSTQLANQAADAVKCGRFPNIIAFHQSLEETKKYSKNAAASTKCAQKPAVCSLNSFPNSSNNKIGECSSIVSPRTSTNSELNDAPQPSKFSLKTEQLQAQQTCTKSSLEEKQRTNETNNNSSNAAGAVGRSKSVDSGFSPAAGADAGNLPIIDVPFINSGGDPLEKMARLTQETLPFEPPLKQQKIGSPREKAKLSDDQLTPAARQHRHEALQKIEGIRQVFGLSQPQPPQPSIYMLNQPPMIGMPPPQDPMKMEPCPSTSRSEAQLNWERECEEHKMKMQNSAMSKMGGGPGPPMPDGVPTMMMQGKPAAMVHPVSVPRHPNSRGVKSAGARLMTPLTHNSDGYMPPNGFDSGFCPNFEFIPQQQQPQPRCFVIQQPVRMPPGMGPPPGQPMYGPRPMAPDAVNMNLNMNIHVNPPKTMVPQPYYHQEFVGVLEEEDTYYEGGMCPPGVNVGMCGGNMQPMSSNTYFCGPNGVMIEENGGGGGGNGQMPPRGAQPMVNNTFVNATMSIQQVNIQNCPFPGSNIVRVQSMQPSQSVPAMPYMVAPPNGPPPQGQLQQPQQQQQFLRRPASYSPMHGQSARNFGPESTRFLLQDFAEPLRNLDSKVPSQKLQYFPSASQPRPFDANAPPPPPQGPPQHLAQQQSMGPPSADGREMMAPNAVVSFCQPSNDGGVGGRPNSNDVGYQNFQQQLYSMNRRSDSLSN